MHFEMSIIFDTVSDILSSPKERETLVNFEEKSEWVTLVSLLVVSTMYWRAASSMLGAGVTAPAAYVPLVIGVVVALVVLLVAGHIVAAMFGSIENPDERDRLFEWKAEARASWLLGLGVLTALVAVVLPVERIWVAHCLLISMVASEVCKSCLKLVSYRRGS